MATLHEHPSWLLHEHGYRPERESGVESRFAVSNGFLGVRAARAISRGAMWVSWSHTLSWASWPRTYVAGLFDTPNIQPPVPALVPGPDWLRIRLLVDGEPLVLRLGQLLDHRRTLDMRRGLLLGEWRHRNRAGHTVHVQTLRLVSLAERALGLQLMQLSVDRPAEISLEALMEGAGSGLDAGGWNRVWPSGARPSRARLWRSRAPPSYSSTAGGCLRPR